MHADLGPILKAAYPQVVATLVRILGDMDKATDATQDALVKALQQWQSDGVPAQPVAWLVTVARNRAIDQLRREARAVSLDSNVVPLSGEGFVSQPDLELALSDVDDDLLRLMFTCCHPVLAPATQITLILKVVLGFSAEEIARALLTTKAGIDKRLTRAKQRLREAGVEYEVPLEGDLPARLEAVLKAIYLLFNEGYTRMQDSMVARNSLIDEALRLARMTSRLFRRHPEPRSLLALILLSAARLPGRIDANGRFVPLHDQDRHCWDQAMIAEGVAVIDAVCAARHPPGPYQIQAAISALHCQAASSEATDWQQIAGLYETLKRYDASPVVVVNQAVAQCFCGQTQAALTTLEALRDAGQLADYQPLHAALAHAYQTSGASDKAAIAYQRALELAASAPQKAYLRDQLNACQDGLK